MEKLGVAIGVMCKPPRPGVSKTRLAAHIGGEAAARLSAAFLRDVAACAERTASLTGANPYALYAPEDAEGELRQLLPASFRFMPQREGDLGRTMHRAISDLLAIGHPGAMVVGADLPTLPESLLVEAVDVLRARPECVVLGPSLDGGYYLIGMCVPQPALFSGIAWSTADVLSATMVRAEQEGLAVHLLAQWHDVDDGASFAYLRRELSGRSGVIPGGPAFHTRQALLALDEADTGREAHG